MEAFENLGSTLLPGLEPTVFLGRHQGQSLRLPDGLLLPKKALHLKAVQLDSSHRASEKAFR